MGHQRQWCFAEDTFQSIFLVDEHVASRASHEHFDARYAMLVKFLKKGSIIVGGAKEEGVVHMAFGSCQPLFLIKGLQGGRLRHRVGHVEIAGHTASSRSPALRVYICLSREARLAKMYMVVNDAWQHKATSGINNM